jgi:uncharacterized protein YdiU (UPF0061 family)
VELYREITKANAELVVDWLRVGYVQGSMYCRFLFSFSRSCL